MRSRLVAVVVALCLVGGVFGASAAGATAQDTIVVSEGESIQAAINSASPGDTVLVESGTYEQTVIVNESITLEGNDASLFGNDGELGTAIVVESSDATVTGFEIVGYDNQGISINADGTVLESVTVDATDEGIETTADDLTSLTLDDVSATGTAFTSGADIAADTVTITNSTFSGNSGNGVVVTAQQLTVDNVTASNNGADGAGLSVTISAGAATITNVTAIGNDAQGIDVAEDENSLDSSDVTVRDSTLQSNDNEGLLITGVASATVENVESTGSSFGSGLDIDADDVTILNGTFDNNNDQGVDVTAQQLTVDEITANNNADSAEGLLVTLSEGSATITNVTAIGNELQGIKITEDGDPVEPSDVTVRDSTLQSNDNEGLLITGVASATVENVESTGSSFSPGLSVTAEVVDLSNSRFADNSGSGAVIDADDVEIDANEYETNAEFGLEITTSNTDLTLTNASIVGNDGGGITVDGVGDFSTQNAVITQNNGLNLDLAGDASTNQTVVVDDIGEQSDLGGLAIDVGDTGTVTVEDVAVDEAEFQSGLDVTAGAVAVRSSSFTNNDDFGATLAATTVTINGTEFTNNGDDGESGLSIILSEGSTTIANATAAGNDGQGIDIGENENSLESSDVTVRDSTLDGNDNHGLRIAGMGSVTVENVESTGSSFGSGLDIDADEVTITGGSFDGNNDEGLVVSAQQVTVDEITANNNGEDAGPGLDVTLLEGSATITNVTASNNGDQGIDVAEDGDSTDSSDVTTRDVVAQSNAAEGLRVVGVASATIERVESTGSSFGSGLDVDADDVTILNGTFDNNNDQGVDVTAQQLTVDEITANNNGEDAGPGLDVTLLEGSATITNVTASNNGDHGVNVVESEDSTDPGDVTLRDVIAQSNTDEGLRIVGVASATIERVESTGSSLDPGLRLAADSFSVERALIDNNDGVGIVVDDLAEESTVRNSSITDNAEGAVTNNADPLVDATENWWGSPDGPADEDIVGNVEVEPPLDESPFAPPTPADYADEDGIIRTDGLRQAVDDWQAGDIGTDVLTTVIDAWSSGEPVDQG